MNIRSVRLVRIAADAERLRLRRRIRRAVISAVLGGIALLFALFALGAAHLAFYLALNMRFMPVYSALIVLGVDVGVLLVLGVLAMRGGEDRLEREAREVRDQAMGQVRDNVAFWVMLAPLGRIFGKRGVYGGVLAALTARFLASR